ncbi:hypothetical protein D3C81_1905320 [compost metagenome]
MVQDVEGFEDPHGDGAGASPDGGAAGCTGASYTGDSDETVGFFASSVYYAGGRHHSPGQNGEGGVN